MNKIEQRVTLLRATMQNEELAGFIIPTGDPHNSEYTPDYWKIREWLTGFNGSAGTAVVLKDKAALWTDSRYWLAAEEILSNTPFELMRDGLKDTPSIAEWLNENLQGDCAVGFVGEMAAQDFCLEICKDLHENIELTPQSDFFSELWSDRPTLSDRPLIIMSDALAGSTVEEKLDQVRKTLHLDEDGRYFLANDLADIAYALNLRGSDIPYNPFFVSYLLIGSKNAVLFVDPKKITPEIEAHLTKYKVSIEPYDEIACFLSDMENISLKLPQSLNVELAEIIGNLGIEAEYVSSPLLNMRAIKNAAEQDGFRDAMLHDGRALVRFRRWLDEAVKRGGETEISIDRKLTALRAEEKGFAGLSFETIAAYAEHGAIVHYEATPETDVPLQARGLLLLDTGAHYENGTTDITRTIALGETTEEERRVYTLVLKGHIALSNCRFPEGTNGLQLDLAARYAMWKEGYDFGHGTGHGVGTRMGVHEGPHQIRKDKRACTMVPLEAGMTVTNEPGIYIAGRFGVRIENTLLVKQDITTKFGSFLCFEPLTLCPIDTAPIERSLLNKDEADWLNAYHAMVRERLLPTLDDEGDKDWLIAATRPLELQVS